MAQDPDRRAQRRKDFWQLHVPLVLVLALCTLITIIEVRRATEGVWRAWVYMFEWPLIAAFAVWIWHRYRTKGSLFKSLQERWTQRIERLNADADAEPGQGTVMDDDPELRAWREYTSTLERTDPKDTPLR